MTDKEAIERLLSCGEDCLDCMTCVAHDEALAVAVGALREREERSKECRECKYFRKMDIFEQIGYKFCPMCGRKLKGADNG